MQRKHTVEVNKINYTFLIIEVEKNRELYDPQYFLQRQNKKRKGKKFRRLWDQVHQDIEYVIIFDKQTLFGKALVK